MGASMVFEFSFLAMEVRLMRVGNTTAWAVALVLSLALSGPAAVAGPVGLIDDFSGDLSAYTNTKILDANGGGSNTYTWQITNQTLEIATSVFDGIEQSALTRTDYTLDIGEELQADYSGANLNSQDIGLYVGSVTPTMGVRADYVNIYVRNNGQLFSRGFNGSTELPLSGGGTPTVDTLFIAHTGDGAFDLGYYEGGTRNILATRTGLSGITGGAIGFYSDVRAAGVRGNLDNLRIVPEPACCLLGLLGFICIGLSRSRAVR
jgi:hypothetical protein